MSQVDQGNVIYIRTNSKVFVSAKNTTQLEVSLLHFLCKELCVLNLH